MQSTTAISSSAPEARWHAGVDHSHSRISHADELQLACRLSECRRELLAIALLLPEGTAQLRRIHADPGTGRDAQSRAGLAELSNRLTALGAELSAVLDAAQPDAAPLDAAPREVAEEPVARGIETAIGLLEGTPLREIEVAKIMRAARCGQRAGPARPSRSRVARPARVLAPSRPHVLVLRRRAARLSGEIDRIRSRFVSANQGLVTYVVARYIGMGLNEADLKQEANIGLMRAVDKFDHRRGSRFGTYAIWWIRQSVRRALANQSRMIRIPVHALGARYTLERTAQRLAAERGGRTVTNDELASRTGVHQKSIEPLLNLVKEPLSLDAPRGAETDIPIGDSIPDSVTPSGLECAARNERADRLRELLCELPERERDMLRMRFGLDGYDECTLEQIGDTFSLTRERVRQIVLAALQKLERQTELQKLDLTSVAE